MISNVETWVSPDVMIVNVVVTALHPSRLGQLRKTVMMREQAQREYSGSTRKHATGAAPVPGGR